MKKASCYIPAISLSILLSIFFLGCSKQITDKVASSDNPLLSEQLLQKLPDTTAGFAVFNFEGEGYKRLQKSPYGGKANAREALSQVKEALREVVADEKLVDLAQKIFDTLEKLGMVSPDGTYTPEKVVRSTVFFACSSPKAELPLELGLFARAAAGVDPLQQLKAIQSSLKDSGMPVSPASMKNGEAFSVEIKDSKAKVIFGANKSYFGLSTSAQAIELLLSSVSSQTLATLKELPEYKRSASLLAKADKPIAFAFASLNRLEPILEHIAKTAGSGDLKVKDLPVEAVSMISSFPEGYFQSMSFAVTPRTDSQARLIKALESSSLPPKSTTLPNDAAFAVSFDPRFLLALDSFVQEVKSADQPSVIEQLEHARAVTIGLRNNGGGAPVPDLMLSIDTSSRDSLRSILESSIGNLLSVSGQAAPWQTKEIAGNQTRFFSTLIGAGVYMTAPEVSETLMIGTSEAAIKDLAASQKSPASGLIESLPAALRSQVSSANMLQVYLNFPRIAEVLESIKSTLAMFTGGSSELNDVLSPARIRTWGLAAGSVSYTSGSLLINTGLNPPAA